MADSESLMTDHPWAFSLAFTTRSLAALRFIFALQYHRLLAGNGFRPCQKSESQKIAIFSLGNAKSGRPMTRYCNLKPLKPFRIKAALRIRSGVVLALRICDIIRLRTSLGTVSGDIWSSQMSMGTPSLFFCVVISSRNSRRTMRGDRIPFLLSCPLSMFNC